LEDLDLFNNKISHAKPLESLTSLKKLRLTKNPISPKICPVQLRCGCFW
jgi:internalin A